MAKIDELKTAVDAETVEVTALQGAVADEEKRVQSIIDTLKAQASGTPDSALDPVIASLTDLAGNLHTINAGITAFTPA